MENLDINNILNRHSEIETFKQFLYEFEANKSDLLINRGVYIYGNPGTGKTVFVQNLLKSLNYDIISYDASDIRNKRVINEINTQHISNVNVLSLLHNKHNKNTQHKKICILMDEVDGMNGGDKGGLCGLIQLIRPKKTKKQRNEVRTMVPVICIGSYKIDKKIIELTKVCINIELKPPTDMQIQTIINAIMPTLHLGKPLLRYVNGDLRTICNINNIYNQNTTLITTSFINTVLHPKILNKDNKQITHEILTKKYKFTEHDMVLNETDRTSVGLLFHENIIDRLETSPLSLSIPLYIEMLNNICFADYIDRITFQKQIWLFNEMSSLIKTFYNNTIWHTNIKSIEHEPTNIRFTKVLTKYSTEYNNSTFIQHLCGQLKMDRNDMISYFINLRKQYTLVDIYNIFDNCNTTICKLDVNRIYKYIKVKYG
jgi:DNA polymerase III delta prime subunit